MISDLLKNNQRETAGTIVKRAAELSRNATYHLILGDIQLQQNNLDAAETSYQKSLDLNPQYAAAAHGLGNIHARRGQLEPARQFF